MAPTAAIDHLRETIDDALRRLTSKLIESIAETEDDPPSGVMLADWVVVVELVETDDPSQHWYRTIGSVGISPHAQTGLLQEALEE